MPRPVPHKKYDAPCKQCRQKYTHFTENEITGSYHNEKSDPVLVAVGIMIVVCGIIYLVAFN